MKLKLYYNNNKKIKKKNQKVFLCTCPYITPNGTFIFNGSERVIVYQLYRSPGLFFNSFYHYSGIKLYYSKLIPSKGSWLEFIIDINNIIYVYIDKRKKILLTIFLKAIGYRSNKNIMKNFNLYKKIKIKKKNIKHIIGKKNLFKIKINKKLDFKKNIIFNKKNINFLKKNNIKYVYIKNNNKKYNILKNTFKKDKIKNYKESIFYFYKKYKKILPPNIKIAKKFIKKLFFSKKKYSLGRIGRYKLNKILKLKLPYNLMVITKKDIIYIIKYLINLIKNKKKISNEIDSLSNKKVKTISELLFNLFNIGILRISKKIKKKFTLKKKKYSPIDLINTKILTSIINTFFGTNQLSQFMDKTNPLSEITHKRRLTLLGPGGLTRERASFEARDVNYSYYGRLCPIETPEGPNIGLISSLCLFAKINDIGFLETPYYKIINYNKKNYKKKYLISDKEYNKKIASFNFFLKKKKKIIVRYNNDFILIKKKKINYIDYSNNQILSISASLIPFLEHDDANRALMGSNMMRQAVPLLKLEVPIVGTGLEKKIVNYSRNIIKAKENGIIKYVDSNKIIIKYNFSKKKKYINFYKKYYTYYLSKFKRTNQNTCLNFKPKVHKNQKIKKNQILSEGFAIKNGKLALGKNLLVAFMSWKGYNFEDAILISNRILRDDYFTSIHIEEYSLEIRNNKLGKEEFTNDIPNINKNDIKNINENGLIKIGTKIKPGDILIGKIVPKDNIIIKPEEKLLKSIFGNKYNNVKDSSLRAHSSLYGTVINTEIIKKKKKIKKLDLKIKIKKKKLYKIFFKKIFLILKYYNINFNNLKTKSLSFFFKKKKKDFFNFLKIKNKKILKLINKLIINLNLKKKYLLNKYKRKKIKILIGNDLSNDIIKIAKIYIAKKRKIKVGDKMSGRHGNKGVISKIIKDEDMPFLKDGTVIDIILNPLSVPSRMNIGQVLESILGLIGLKIKKNFYTPIFNGKNIKNIYKYSKKNNIKNFSKTVLYDGKTGIKFDNKITIGVIYMFKLGHMVDDKMHARSIGPYSLITQQPLGGKSQFGGQRFGEMEVWALEAFGASNILRELLTIKSDDIKGRSKTYESIVKGKKIPEPGIPESFNVLTNELKGLCLNLNLE
ncbi:MAG: DNA-directed RNA polymerase subunit beta [Candidatus Shikimatogenerans bostrichidophilus]|nr:MAG: DNA-directed RNA polymerase subunit beta [Candidatus Shikimatogenerans bostrichidophilus]